MSSNANERVREVLQRLVEQGPELGLQVAAYQDGELIVDAWAGVADAESRQPVDGQTLFWASSVGKGIAATCVHMLAERGRVEYESPVARYWPEFAANGKEGVTVRHVLSHKAGVPTPPEPFETGMLVDWEAMCDSIANMPLAWEPGSRTAYHNYTFGFITGELIRRVDGRRFPVFVQEEVCAPLGIDSLFFGVPSDDLARVATVTPDSDYNRAEFRQACIPSSDLITNARSLARHYAMLAEGGAWHGTRLLSAERVRLAAEVQTDDWDDLWKVRVKRGLGYRLADDTGPGAGAGALGHVGAAMFGYADPARHFAIGFVKNYRDQATGVRTGEAVYAAITEKGNTHHPRLTQSV